MPPQEKVATPAGETTINNHQSMFLTGERESVREHWGISTQLTDVNINSNKKSAECNVST